MSDNILAGRYKILSPLGSGGFGETYLAEDTQFPGNPQCVVKKLKPQVDDPSIWQDACRLFQQEAETLSQLGKHDQIPQLFAHFEENEHFFLVQELIEGKDLSDELAFGKQNSEYYTTLMLQDILEVLEFVHQKGVIHRDIKPSNLIRRRSDGKIVLIDFGAVKAIGLQTTVPHGNTAHTVSVCTPGYSPNEQLSGQPKLASDIYAVGMIGIQSLTGKFPSELPKDPTTGEILWKENVQVSAQLANLLDQMVLYDFRHRFQDATRAKNALLQLHQQPATIVNPAHAASPSSTMVSPSPAASLEETRIQEVSVTNTPSTAPQTTTASKPTRKGRIPIRTFFAALFLGIISGSAGTVYVIQRFFPSFLRLAESNSPTEQPLAVGGVEEANPSEPEVELEPSAQAPKLDSPPQTPETTGVQVSSRPQQPIDIDYEPLQAALEAGQWKNSDQITRDIMLRLTGRAGSFLRIEDIETIPCADFNTINQLWSNASQGRFGFQAQQLTWQKIAGKAAENVPQSNARNASTEFLQQTLWSYQYISRDFPHEYQNLIFSINAPVGHLPAQAYIKNAKIGDKTKLDGVAELLPTVSQRSAFCAQNPQPSESAQL